MKSCSQFMNEVGWYNSQEENICATLLLGIYHKIKKKGSKKILDAVAYNLANNLHAGNCVPKNLKIVSPFTFSPLWSFFGNDCRHWN